MNGKVNNLVKVLINVANQLKVRVDIGGIMMVASVPKVKMNLHLKQAQNMAKIKNKIYVVL